MKTVFAVLMVLSGFLIVHVMHLYNPDDLPGYVGYAVGAVLSIMGIFASMVGALLLSNRITIIIGRTSKSKVSTGRSARFDGCSNF